MNRRQWLKSTVAGVAGLAVARQLLTTPARAQHEVDRSAKRSEPVRISGNENPFGPSQAAQAAMLQAMEKSCRYPFKESQELIALIAAKEGCSKDNVVLGVGSGEILDIVGFHFGLQKGEIVAAEPGYTQLMRAAEAQGGKSVWVPLNKKLEHDLPAMAAKMTDKTSMVYVCNPNNPTGTVVNAAELKAFAIEASKKMPVFIDEAYLDCADDYEAQTAVKLVAEGHNVVVARTFSKIYGMAGLRMGYGIMPAKLAKEVKPLSTGSVNMMGVVAATASLQDATYVAETRAKIKAGRDALIAVIKGLGKEYAEPQGNFVFFKTGMPIKTFQEKMLAEMVQVARPFPPMLEWARISIGLPEEMAVCHAALKKALA
ncbi:MAG: histidinol-phosphate aminotransferase family protein [Undibacterium sp.]|nr:histidinol-phosphate aminotransferase family protein [Opitutaceae bacterium]